MTGILRLSATNYFVATNGNDTHRGTLPLPFQTIQKAATIAVAGDTVNIRAGTYRETVLPAHSGASNAPITFQAYQDEVVTINGADVIAPLSWSAYSNHIYSAPMPWSLESSNQVFLDGQMLVEARFPNTTLDISRPVKLLAEAGSHSGTKPKVIATVSHSALKQPANYWVGATINIAMGKVWVAETATILSNAPGWVSFRTSGDAYYLPNKDNPFFLFGQYSELDVPGEWFHHTTEHRLYLWPPQSDPPATHRVEAKRRQFAFDLRGRSHINIRGLRLFACSITTDADSTDILLDALDVKYVSHWTQQVRWKTGTYDSGIILAGTRCTIQNSTIAYSAGNGVALKGNLNTASNNIIHDVDYSGNAGAGINTGKSQGNVIAHNSIYDSGHRLIDIGGLEAGYVHHNEVWHGGLQMTDFGGIYTVATQGKGTRICYNVIRDCDGPSNGLKQRNNSKGIYIDNGASDYVLDHNVTWNVDNGIILNSRPDHPEEVNRNVIILNNTLHGGRSYGWRENPNPGGLIANNIFLASDFIHPAAKASNNLSAKTDPKFIESARNNYQLQPGSPAIDGGLQYPPYTDGFVGSAPDLGAYEQGRPAWKAGAK